MTTTLEQVYATVGALTERVEVCRLLACELLRPWIPSGPRVVTARRLLELEVHLVIARRACEAVRATGELIKHDLLARAIDALKRTEWCRPSLNAMRVRSSMSVAEKTAYVETRLKFTKQWLAIYKEVS